MKGSIARMKLAPPFPRRSLWESLWDMDSLRQRLVISQAMGPGRIITHRIPIDKIHWYAQAELGLSGDDKEAFVWIMRHLDIFYVGLVNKS